MNVTDPHPAVHAVKLKEKAESVIKKAGHPWIFEGSLSKDVIGKPGDVCVLFGSRNNKVFAVGLLDPQSPIRIKVLHYGGPATVNESFFRTKILKAFELRQELLSTGTNSYRLIFGENDGFPGLVLDVYGGVAVLKLYSSIWVPYLHLVVTVIAEVSGCKAIVLRLSRSLESSTVSLQDGEVIYGKLETEEVEFLEHGLRFLTNVIKGHKTGYFLDHRHNRVKVGEYSKNKSVLDVFSYTGGFTVHALAGGAADVTSVDISEKALEFAERNVQLNEKIIIGKHRVLKGDAFEVLKSLIAEKKQYDVVVIDPPSFANSVDQVNIALKKYFQLAGFGVKLTAPNGLLVLASCSSRVNSQDFFNACENAITRGGRKFSVLEKTGHDADHPVTFKEGAYLKCGYYRLR